MSNLKVQGIDVDAGGTVDGRDVSVDGAKLDNVGSTTNAIVPPSVTDDSNSGYYIGSRWIDTVNDAEYICVDASIGAAVWKGTTSLTLNSVDSTGVLSGGILSVGTGGPGVATTYDIADGEGQVVTNLGARTNVSWTGLTGLTPIFGPSVITFVAIDITGAVVTQSTPFTRIQARTNIVLGVIVHVNGINVDTVNNAQQTAYNPMLSLHDAMESIGFFNVSGNVFSPNGANLTIDKSLGSLFKMGSNYDIAATDNPHIRTNAATTGGIFQYRFSDGSSGILTETNIDPDNLDDGAGGLTALGVNKWSVQRIYLFTSNNIKIQRGVTEYSTSDAAIQGIPTEPYVTEPSITANALFRGWLVVKQGTTALNTVDAIFLQAGKFGESGGSVGSGSTTTLQAAYDNSTPNPEILTSATNLALTMRRGSGADTDHIYEGKNGAGTTTFSVTGAGKVTGLDFNGVPLTTAGSATTYLNAAGAYTTPAGGGGGVGTIESNITTGIASVGGATTGFLASTNNINEYQIQGGGAGDSKIIYYSMIVPADYASGGSLKIDSWTTDFVNLTTWTATVYINGTVDATVNALNIKPSVNSTYQTSTSVLGSTIAAGNVLQIKLNFTGANGDDIRIRRITLEYNR